MSAKKATGAEAPHYVWHDREIRFDSNPKDLDERRGEYKIDGINSVEDTKGNNGDRGSLIVTNLRLLWISHKRTSTNLSIGYNTVLHINIRKAKSRLRGSTQALYIMTKFGSSRFEFIFTSLVKNSPRLFTTTQAVLRAYETSKLYRDLKLRSSIIKDGQLMLLPGESVINTMPGIWNLSSDQGNLGSFTITNVRLVWAANLAQNFNVSIPYMQIKDIKTRPSKFGDALVVSTSPKAGGYVLGFRVDPDRETLDRAFNEINSLHKVYSTEPIFGVDFQTEAKPEAIEAVTVKRVVDDIEIVQQDDEAPYIPSSYLAEANKQGGDREVQFDQHLGLAIEALQGSTTTQNLWTVASYSSIRGPDGAGPGAGPGGAEAEAAIETTGSVFSNR
mmetsp:Transcript_66149/g.182580  ORF Transcript_66149/g.182580 Transcript_66149/m.182580 type:complete len:389 (-) Transcript_66149:182-1348(-)